MQLNNFRIGWNILFWVLLIVVLALALMPNTDNLPTTGWDKANHLLAFITLCILGLLAYPKHTVAVLLGLLLYGGLIEVLQSFTPNRSAEVADLVTDGLGLVVGWKISLRIKKATA
jgi:VanZ family protein